MTIELEARVQVLEQFQVVASNAIADLTKELARTRIRIEQLMQTLFETMKAANMPVAQTELFVEAIVDSKTAQALYERKLAAFEARDQARQSKP